MRALPFFAAAMAWSMIASADTPDGGPPPWSGPRPMRSPVQFNPMPGSRIFRTNPNGEPPAPKPLSSAYDPRTAPPYLPPPAAAPPRPPVIRTPAAAPDPATTTAPPSPAPNLAAPVTIPAPVPPPARPHRKPRPRKPEPPPLPAPDLKLTIDAPSPEAPWTIRLQNTGAIPIRIDADARLVSLDITPPDAKRAIKCELPSDMRPNDDDDRMLVLPPGRAFVEKIDPRLFCFGAKASLALVSGASVAPRLVGSRELAVVEPIEEVEPVVATAHEWTGIASPIGAPVVATTTKDPAHARSLAITTPAFVDVARASEVAIAITAKNESNAPVVFLLRPETVALDITGPSGIGVTDPSPTVHCAWSAPPPSAIRDLFSHVGPSGSDSVSVLPSVLCPEAALDHPGLYVVRAKLDTRHASGVSVGLHTLDGEVVGETTTRLRVRETTGKPLPTARPQLEVVAAH